MLPRHDISQYYSLKSTFEQILGQKAWLTLKECTSLAEWKKQIKYLLCAILISAKENIEVVDDAWIVGFEDLIKQGKNAVQSAKSIDELLAALNATLIKVVFLQLGCVPNRRATEKISLAGWNWKLNHYRSVQYIQNKSQLEALHWHKQQHSIGPKKQMELKEQHRTSESKLSYFEWCREREKGQDK